MDYSEYLRRLPKVELHCHVEGTLRPATVVDLAHKHGIRCRPRTCTTSTTTKPSTSSWRSSGS